MSTIRDPDIAAFSRITTRLFSAAIGHGSWENFLETLTDATGGVCTHIIGFDEQAGLALDMAGHGYDPDYISTYRAHYNKINAWAPGFMQKPVGVVVDSEDMYPSHALKRTEFYNDWLRPQEDIIHGGGAAIFRDETRMVALGGNIRERDCEALKAPWLRMVGYLIPHLRQAFDISRALTGARLESLVLSQSDLRDLPGIAVLSATGRLLFANAPAEDMLDLGHPIATDWQGRLTCTTHDRLLSDLTTFRLTSLDPSFTLDVAGDDGTTWQLRFSRFDLSADLPFLLAQAMTVQDECLLLVISRKEPAVSRIADISRSIGLTRTEAEVALLVAEGLSSREISERRGISLNTARNQVQSAMTKGGVRRRMELARIVQGIRPGP
jgi:DNA-binding CsgD family transcriptional regulator